MRTLSEKAVFEVVDATWAPFARHSVGPWVLREGRGGGQRVSTASCDGTVTERDIADAARAMGGLGQTPLFMVREDQPDLDQHLADAGYQIKDPVDVLAMDARVLARRHEPGLSSIFTSYPMAMLAEIWAAGGIGLGRLDVMRRVAVPKTFVMGRFQARAAGAAFVGLSDGVAMAHAVEVLVRDRRQGVAERMMAASAWWAVQQGADVFSVLTTRANTGAQKLYRKMGMETVSQYHYRIKTS